MIPPTPLTRQWDNRLWMSGLSLLILWGLLGYRQQLQTGLAVTALTDQAPWGLYIANFLFLVGIAASAIILVAAVPIFHRQDLAATLLPAKALAITAVTMSLLFVLVDLGHPERILHALPVLGTLNFPTSIMAWDILALIFYLVLNIGWLLYHYYGQKQSPTTRNTTLHTLGILLTILLGLSIHTLTAFLLAGLPAHPLWHTPLLAPRFIISATAAGTALMTLLFRLTRHRHIPDSLFPLLNKILTAALLTHLFFLGSELFVLLYTTPRDHQAAHSLYLGWNQGNPWTYWILAALGMILLATGLLLHPQWRTRTSAQGWAAALTLIGIWMEKGLGLLLPGFIPTPLGEQQISYHPTLVEIQITLAIWALGALILTALLRMFEKIDPPLQP
ncbi:MAG: polysulfide reductase NrfD [Magnetococcales bacterium]|nr:polysulfide reductase NrfD [Magnetococcales bacterium]